MRIAPFFMVLGIMAACSAGSTTGNTGGSITGISRGSTSGHTGGSTGGSISAGATATSGSTVTSTGGNCGGTNGGGCSSLVNGGPVTNVVDVPTVPPLPSGGGAPPDGTYYLTSVLAYTGDGGAAGETSETFQATIQISGSGTEFNQVGDHDGCLFTGAGSFSFGATQVNSTTTCPVGEGGASGYTSTSTTLTFFSTDLSPEGAVVKEAQVLTLQQP